MKTFKYWVKERVQITVAGRAQEIQLVAGSDISKQAATEDALAQAQRIEQRIATGSRKEEYDAAIREHIADVIDQNNVITVCRYGAKVLNTTQYTVLDLDDYPWNFLDIFRSLGKLSKKERIVYKFEQRIQKIDSLGQDFRIYETCKGIRVIAKSYLSPRASHFTSLMRKLGVDWIYIDLCRKQNCYRARLTPKPYRMRIKGFKIKTPLDCETQAYEIWAKDYEQQSQSFRVVKLLKTIGRDFSKDSVIQWHDRTCNSETRKRLA